MLVRTRSETEFYIIVAGLTVGVASAIFCTLQLINQQYQYAFAIALHSCTQIGLALYVLKTSKTAISGGLLSLHMVVGTTIWFIKWALNWSIGPTLVLHQYTL